MYGIYIYHTICIYMYVLVNVGKAFLFAVI